MSRKDMFDFFTVQLVKIEKYRGRYRAVYSNGKEYIHKTAAECVSLHRFGDLT